jgi:hypothetical protein
MNRRDVIREIVQRDVQMLGLSAESVLREAKKLHSAACEHFGTWETALQYAGVDMRALAVRDEYSRERVLSRIRRLCRDGHDLAAHRNQMRNRRMYDAARQHFGSWRGALRAAGINLANLRPRSLRLDTNEILDRLRRMHAEGHSMKWTDVCLDNRTLAMAAKSAFRSWRRASVAAGLASDEDVVLGGPRCNPEASYQRYQETACAGQDDDLHSHPRRQWATLRGGSEIFRRLEGGAEGGWGGSGRPRREATYSAARTYVSGRLRAGTTNK